MVVRPWNWSDEFRLLHFFMTHPERVHSRSQLLDYVWGDHVFVEERTVDVHIRRLRQALTPTGHDRHVETVRGSGYRFTALPTESQRLNQGHPLLREGQGETDCPGPRYSGCLVWPRVLRPRA